MDIVLCLKQVPDVDDIKLTKENNLDRSLMLSKLNPCDEFAIETAVKLKQALKDVSITAISMGPENAKEVLNYAAAKGADRAILLSDKAFAASDTLVTSKILASAIKKFIPNFSLVLTGQMAQDGDTAQVPVSLAQYLDIPDVTCASDIVCESANISVVQKTGSIMNFWEINMPCLVALNDECEEKTFPKINDYIRAQSLNIEVYGLDDIGLDKNEVGIIGSPTRVYRAFRPENKKNTAEISSDFAKFMFEQINKVKK